MKAFTLTVAVLSAATALVSGSPAVPGNYLTNRADDDAAPADTPADTPAPPADQNSKPCTAEYVDMLLYEQDIDAFIKIYGNNDPEKKYPSCDWNLRDCFYFPESINKDYLDDFRDACRRLDFARRNTVNQGRYDKVKSAVQLQFLKDMNDICAKRMEEPFESLCEGAANEYYRFIEYIGVGTFKPEEYNRDSPTRTQNVIASTGLP